MNWARAHWLVGVLALIVFPLTGQYMLHAADVPHLDSVPRLVFRSRHLLFLAAAVANLALSNAQPFRRAQKAASLLVMLSPALLLAGFFIDPGRGLHSSTIFRLAMYGLFVAGVLLAIANRPQRRGNVRPEC